MNNKTGYTHRAILLSHKRVTSHYVQQQGRKEGAMITLSEVRKTKEDKYGF